MVKRNNLWCLGLDNYVLIKGNTVFDRNQYWLVTYGIKSLYDYQVIFLSALFPCSSINFIIQTVIKTRIEEYSIRKIF